MERKQLVEEERRELTAAQNAEFEEARERDR
jgi:hypothetical protein